MDSQFHSTWFSIVAGRPQQGELISRIHTQVSSIAAKVLKVQASPTGRPSEPLGRAGAGRPDGDCSVSALVDHGPPPVSASSVNNQEPICAKPGAGTEECSLF
jgi:hypothetical protein